MIPKEKIVEFMTPIITRGQALSMEYFQKGKVMSIQVYGQVRDRFRERTKVYRDYCESMRCCPVNPNDMPNLTCINNTMEKPLLEQYCKLRNKLVLPDKSDRDSGFMGEIQAHVEIHKKAKKDREEYRRSMEKCAKGKYDTRPFGIRRLKRENAPPPPSATQNEKSDGVQTGNNCECRPPPPPPASEQCEDHKNSK